MLVNKRELSDLFGVSQQAITNWQKEGLPVEEKLGKGKKNQYNTVKCFSWIRKKDAAKKISEKDIEHTRLLAAQAEYKEIEVKQLKAELLPVIVIIETWQSMIIAAKTRITAIASDVKSKAPEVENEVLQVIKNGCREALEELSSDGLPNNLRKRVAKHLRDMETAGEYNGK